MHRQREYPDVAANRLVGFSSWQEVVPFLTEASGEVVVLLPREFFPTSPATAPSCVNFCWYGSEPPAITTAEAEQEDEESDITDAEMEENGALQGGARAIAAPELSGREDATSPTAVTDVLHHLRSIESELRGGVQAMGGRIATDMHQVIQAPVAAEALKTADGFSPKKRKKTQRADEVRIEQRDAIKWAGDGLLSIVDKLGDAVRKLEVSCPM